MKRRTLLQLSSLCGVSAALPWFASESGAQSDGYAGPYWIFVTASGGWDPRFLFDPTLVPEQNRIYTEIGTIGNISFAPIDATPEELNIELAEGESTPIVNPERFLERFGSRLTVINGIDTSTNNHDTGRRAFTSGSLTEGHPAIGAMLAASHGLARPLPFISFGGYDATFGIAPLSRLGSSRVLQNLAEPNVISPQNEDSDTFHTPDTYDRIRRAQGERLTSIMGGQHLPRLLEAQRALELARATDAELKQLVVPELIDLPGGLNRAEGMLQAGQLAVAAFKAGLGISANLEIGGFDTHGNHDRDQRLNLIQLLTGVANLVDFIDAEGMTDSVNIVVGSDFGRTPHYNGEGAGDGKDHWPITSYMALGPNIAGDRVIGGTTDDQTPLAVDPSTLEISESGVKITPGEIHTALRGLSGLSDELNTQFPLLGQSLPLFG